MHWIGLVTALLLGSQAYGAEQSRLLLSARNQARGGTFVAAFDSDEASRGNPAAMTDTNVSYQLRIAQLDAFLGDNSVASLSQLTTLGQQSSATSIIKTFSDKFGKRQYGRGQLAPMAMRFGNFEVMPFATTTNFIDLRDPALPEVTFLSDTLYGAVLAYALPLSKELSISASLTPATRSLYSGSIGLTDLIASIGQSSFRLDKLFDKSDGTYFGLGLGAIYRPSATFRLGVNVDNLGYANAFFGGSKPPALSQVVALGMVNRTDWKPWHLDQSLDLQDVVNPNKYNAMRLLHLGLELGRPYFTRDHDIGLGVGLNEGYLTSGGFLDIYIFRLTLSYYAMELGEYPGQRKDRRWGASILSSLTF